MTEGQPPAPSYFVYDAILNRKERDLLDEGSAPAALNYERTRELMAAGAMLVDGRTPEEFALGYLVGAVNVGLNGRYAEFAGSVIPSDVDIVLFVEPGQQLEAKTRLARIGFDRVVGYLAEPTRVMLEHPDDVRQAPRLTAADFEQRQGEIDGLQLVDVRNPGEYQGGTIADAPNIPVGQLPGRVDELDPSKPTIVFCAGGYRSSVAASVLRQAGFTDVSDIIGGYSAWTERALAPA